MEYQTQNQPDKKRVIIVTAVMAAIVLILLVAVVIAAVSKKKNNLTSDNINGSVNITRNTTNTTNVSVTNPSKNATVIADDTDKEKDASKENPAPVANDTTETKNTTKSQESETLPATGPEDYLPLILLLGVTTTYLLSLPTKRF